MAKPQQRKSGNRNPLKRYWKAFWHFIWEDDSIWSWLANVALAFIIIKFLVYPGIGLIFSTTHPIVAVMSSSMEHNGDFEQWWNNDPAFCGERVVCVQKDFYAQLNITAEQFQNFKFSNGFNTGDIMVIFGQKDQANIEVGDVIIYWANEPIPIIHRVIKKWDDYSGTYYVTKGDNNPTLNYNELKINHKLIVGKAAMRVPYLGWVKIGFVRLMDKVTSLFA